MKVAVATFGERVSPRFDCAQTFLIVTIDGGRLSKRQHVFASGWEHREQVNPLVALGLEAVVCGGIDLRSAELLQSAGVNLDARRAGRRSIAYTYTYCPACGELLIRRSRFGVAENRVKAGSRCPRCGAAVAGIGMSSLESLTGKRKP